MHRHQFPEKCTNGRSTNAMSAAIALRLARDSIADGTRRNARYPTYKKNRTAVGTRRASHAHHTPHTGRPHREPNTRVRAGKRTPRSADAPASRPQTHARPRRPRDTAHHTADTPQATDAL